MIHILANFALDTYLEATETLRLLPSRLYSIQHKAEELIFFFTFSAASSNLRIGGLLQRMISPKANCIPSGFPPDTKRLIFQRFSSLFLYFTSYFFGKYRVFSLTVRPPPFSTQIKDDMQPTRPISSKRDSCWLVRLFSFWY